MSLTLAEIMAMPFLKLARLVNAESYAMSERVKAANGLHARAAKEMNGMGWVALPNDDKARVRKAMAFDTTQLESRIS